MDRKPASFRRAALWLLCIVSALLVTAALSVNIYFHQLLEKLNYVDPETAPTLSQAQLDAYLATDSTEATISTAPSIEPEHVEFGEAETQIGGQDIINILLIGQDRREGEQRARSDSMILCTFDTENQTLTMTSFLRDLYVQIPGYQNNRINAAYAAGGMNLLGQTLEKNFGVELDGSIEVDFTRFAELIDLLGGVMLELRADEASAINASTPGDLTAGLCMMNGSQALAYARIRKLDSDGDFSRTGRQRKLLQALLSSYRDAGLSRIFSLLEKALPMVTTDLTKEEIVDLVRQLLPILPDMEINGQHIPAEGTYAYKTIRGMAVLVADMDAARQLLKETAGNADA